MHGDFRRFAHFFLAHELKRLYLNEITLLLAPEVFLVAALERHFQIAKILIVGKTRAEQIVVVYGQVVFAFGQDTFGFVERAGFYFDEH